MPAIDFFYDVVRHGTWTCIDYTSVMMELAREKGLLYYENIQLYVHGVHHQQDQGHKHTTLSNKTIIVRLVILARCVNETFCESRLQEA